MNRGVAQRIPPAASHRDHAELYRRHHGDLMRAVSGVVCAPRELIEDACQNVWTIFLRAQPNCSSIFLWLYVVATLEARRLCKAERRYTHLEDVLPARSREAAIVDAVCIDDILEAREALAILASLPDRQREDLTLAVAGFSYNEIGKLTAGRTFNTVRKNLAKAHARVQLLARPTEGPAPSD